MQQIELDLIIGERQKPRGTRWRHSLFQRLEIEFEEPLRLSWWKEVSKGFLARNELLANFQHYCFVFVSVFMFISSWTICECHKWNSALDWCAHWQQGFIQWSPAINQPHLDHTLKDQSSHVDMISLTLVKAVGLVYRWMVEQTMITRTGHSDQVRWVR